MKSLMMKEGLKANGYKPSVQADVNIAPKETQSTSIPKKIDKTNFKKLRIGSNFIEREELVSEDQDFIHFIKTFTSQEATASEELIKLNTQKITPDKIDSFMTLFVLKNYVFYADSDEGRKKLFIYSEIYDSTADEVADFIIKFVTQHSYLYEHCEEGRAILQLYQLCTYYNEKPDFTKEVDSLPPRRR